MKTWDKLKTNQIIFSIMLVPFLRGRTKGTPNIKNKYLDLKVPQFKPLKHTKWFLDQSDEWFMNTLRGVGVGINQKLKY